MKRLLKNSLLLAKNGATPMATDAVDLSEPFVPSISVKSGEYSQLDGKMGNTKTWIADDYMAASGTITAMLKSNGGGAVPPKLHELFLMSGFDGVAIDTDGNGSNDAFEYRPNSSELGTGELIAYTDGIKLAIHKASANLKIDFEVGAPAKVSFDVQGFAEAPVEEANPSVSLDQNRIFVVTSAQAVTLSGATLELTQVSFDMGNQINEIYAIGNKEFYRADFKAKISITEKVGSDIGYWGDFLSGAIKSIEVTLDDGTGNKFIFSAPTLSYVNVSEGGTDELEATREFLCSNDFYFRYA